MWNYMIKCAKCGKEFNPPKDYWKLCFECWKEEKPKIIKKMDGLE